MPANLLLVTSLTLILILDRSSNVVQGAPIQESSDIFTLEFHNSIHSIQPLIYDRERSESAESSEAITEIVYVPKELRKARILRKFARIWEAIVSSCSPWYLIFYIRFTFIYLQINYCTKLWSYRCITLPHNLRSYGFGAQVTERSRRFAETAIVSLGDNGPLNVSHWQRKCVFFSELEWKKDLSRSRLCKGQCKQRNFAFSLPKAKKRDIWRGKINSAAKIQFEQKKTRRNEFS